jgi:hypothetical protein
MREVANAARLTKHPATQVLVERAPNRSKLLSVQQEHIRYIKIVNKFLSANDKRR